MGKIEKMSVSVTHEQAEEIRHAVQEGAFASSSEAVREALRAWVEKRRQKAVALEKIRTLWDEGIASGIAGQARTAADIVAAGRRRLAGEK